MNQTLKHDQDLIIRTGDGTEGIRVTITVDTVDIKRVGEWRGMC